MSKPRLWTFFTTIGLLIATPVAFAFNVSLANAMVAGKSSPIPPKAETEYRIKTVVIDAGHGGHDPGCLGGHSQEKHIALAIALNLADGIRAQFPDINVILTRDDDTFIPLHERAAIANRHQADLFISIHCNYMPGSSATHGSETYVMGLHTADHNLNVAKRENEAILLEEDYEQNYDYDPNSPEGHILLSMFQNAYLEQSILFAEKVEYHFHATAGRRSRGVKQAGFVVLKETTMPSVLVETGFLSNGSEESYLLSEAGQQQVAQAMLAAFRDYKLSLEGPQAQLGARGAPQTDTPSSPPAAARPATSPPPAPAPVRDTPTAVAYRTPAEQPAMPTSPQPRVQQEPIITPRTGTPVNSTATQAPQRTQQPSRATNIAFAVQLAAAPQPQDIGQPQWRNLGYLIEVVEEDHLYKYQARNFVSWEEALEARINLQHSGFPDAFIVAYQDGRRIPLSQARRQLGLD